MMIFDVLQLGRCSILTGGLNNPFALLMLARVTDLPPPVLPPCARR